MILWGDDDRAADDRGAYALARCSECGFLFDPRYYSADWPYCGPDCADKAKEEILDEITRLY